MGMVAALVEKLNNFIFNKYEDNDINRCLVSTVAEVFTVSNKHVSSPYVPKIDSDYFEAFGEA